MAIDFVLLTCSASLDILLDKLIHSWPIDFVLCFSIGLLLSWVSGGVVVVISSYYFSFEVFVVWNNDSVVIQ